MKLRMALAVFLVCFLPSLIHAQIPKVALPKIDLGIKAGADFSSLSGSAWDNSMKPGIVGGAFVGLRVKKVGVQIEALINTAKYTVSGAVSGGDFKTTNLAIPILFQYKIIPMLWLQIGPQYSSVISASGPTVFGDPKSLFKSDFDGVIGLELKTPVKFNIGARYILGLSSENNSSASGAWAKRTAELYIGFRFI